MSDYVDDPYAEEGASSRPGLPLDPARALRVYLRSWRWILVAVAIGALAGVVVAKTQIKKTYDAETVVGYSGTDYGDREVQSMVESITLVQSLKEVQKRLGLKGDVKGLERRIKVAFEPRFSNLMYIRAQASTGPGAKSFADTVATVFIEKQAQLDRAKHDEVARKLQMDLEVAQARLSYAREVYDAFRSRYGVMNLSAETNAALSQAISLRSQAEAAEQAMLAAQGAVNELRSRVSKVGPGPTEVIEEPPTDEPPAESQASLDAVRRKLAAARVRLSPDHPEIKLLEAQVRDLEQRLAGPMDNSARGLSSRLASTQKAQVDAENQFKVLSRSADEAEARLKQLAQGEGEAAPLLADLGVAEARMRDVKSRLSLALDAARNTVPPFHMVALATTPLNPSESSAKLVALAGPILMFVLAMIAVFVRMSWGLRLSTPSEVAFWCNAPVIGATTWPNDPSMLTSLFRELDDCTPYASGLTLIVGAHDSEAPLARGVAMLWPANRFAVSGAAEEERSMSVVEQRVDEVREETPEKVVIGHVGGAGRSGQAAIVPLQVARSSLMRAQPDDLDRRQGGATRDPGVTNVAQSWNGPLVGPELRRASRLADRVLVVVRSGERSALELAGIRTRLGRERGIGVLLVGVDPAYASLKDRVGNVHDFWRATRESTA